MLALQHTWISNFIHEVTIFVRISSSACILSLPFSSFTPFPSSAFPFLFFRFSSSAYFFPLLDVHFSSSASLCPLMFFRLLSPTYCLHFRFYPSLVFGLLSFRFCFSASPLALLFARFSSSTSLIPFFLHPLPQATSNRHN